MTDDDSSNPVDFPTTAWSCIQHVQNPNHPDHVSAVNRFMRTYCKPVFCFLRARGCSFHEAQDATQDFFVRFVLERKGVQNADPDKGRFRAFLLTVLKRFHADRGANRAPRQSLFERQFVAIAALMGDQDGSLEPVAGSTPDEVFNRE
jgi:RNA polymerase sigma-70 factor (ECF subfamily)